MALGSGDPGPGAAPPGGLQAFPMVFRPIQHRRTADEVVERFRALLLDGVLRAGERLPAERQLAADLEVSRPILREALTRLEAEGLVVARQGEGTYVADLMGHVFTDPVARLVRASARGVADYLEFRRMIEADMAAMAAARATEADLAMLAEVGAAMRAAHADGDAAAEARLDVELHTLIVEAAHNIVVLHVLRACDRLLADDVFSTRARLYTRPGERRRLLDQHLALIEAIAARDPDAARAAARAHIDHIEATTARLSASDARAATANLRRELRGDGGRASAG